uniref:Uncharacterized protein isoform X2 n=2 Tax=Nicotiana TaxID=4085 RepID=A0A1S4DQS7_TOBAC|nr:PREDICTED: uncharacterized protein LOC104221925 isoform X3 [Nicotiana sylvestris]XP_016515484.1 PREDICTED: uncharacterized protein LOC107832187 isoform X2 [Nicotiana tabacum]
MNITQVTLSNNSNNSRREIFDPELWKLRAANRRVVEEYEMLLLPSGGLKAQEILQTVNAFGWRSFVQCPGDYNRNIVLEFYSNLNPVVVALMLQVQISIREHMYLYQHHFPQQRWI